MVASETNRGTKLVAVTALVAVAILAYYYWTETNFSKDLLDRLDKTTLGLGVVNRTVLDQAVTLEVQKQQMAKLEEEKKKLETDKTGLEDAKKKLEEEKKKLEEEKAGFEKKIKDAEDNAKKLGDEKKAAEDKSNECTKTCDERITKAVEECRKATGRKAD